MAPIIILGMHRSGTGLICSLLTQMGLFLGKHQDPNSEAELFLSLNRWLFKSTGSSWDHPENFHDLADNAMVRPIVIDYLDYLLRTPRVISFLGLRNYLRYGQLAALDFPWGWKDPRNVFTLPIWLTLFPNARIICVSRHGVDVARSLRERARTLLAAAPKRHQYRKKLGLYLAHPKRDGFLDSIRCLSLYGAFTLWEAYALQTQEHLDAMGDRALSIRFEELLTSLDYIHQMADFCELRPNRELFTSLAKQVNRDRIYAYRRDNEALSFAQQMSDRLARFGY